MAKPKRPDSKLEVLRASGALNPRSVRVRDELFQEQEFFDPRDLVQVRYEMLRRVQKEGQDVAQAAEAFGLSRPSFYKAKEKFQAEGLFGLLPKKRGPRGRHKLSADVLAFAQEARAKDAALDGPALARIIHARFGIRVHPRTIERAMAESKKKRP